MSETPVLREATPGDPAQIVSLFLASVDTSLPGRTVSGEPTYAPADVHARLRARLFPPRSLRTFVLELPSSGTIVGGLRQPCGSAESTRWPCSSSGPTWAAAATAGCSCVRSRRWLLVFKRNERAIRFYEESALRMVEGTEEGYKFEFQKPFEEVVCLMRWSSQACSVGTV
ncbi:hypothetical protein BD413DRAFT_605871 [Trametes elegans]|nr:hypothetical protein BD413DRAFT_605871 [Trametes elegans]